MGSDLDVLIVVDRREVDLVESAREWDLTALPVPADVLVYGERELSDLLHDGGRFGRMLATEAVWIYRRD
ncbi:MAG: hypothetical protein ACRENI_13740 [Gemmatimonadaceae bacterium]